MAALDLSYYKGTGLLSNLQPTYSTHHTIDRSMATVKRSPGKDDGVLAAQPSPPGAISLDECDVFVWLLL